MKELQIKTMLKYHCSCNILQKNLKHNRTFCQWDCGGKLLVGMQIGIALLEGNLAISNKTTYATIILLEIYSENTLPGMNTYA